MTQTHLPMTPITKGVRAAWFMLGGILTAAVLLAGGFLAWQLIVNDGYQRGESQQTRTVEGGEPETVTISGTSATVELTGTQAQTVTEDLDLVWYYSEPVVQTEWQDSELFVDLHCQHSGIPLWFMPDCSITYAAQVPLSSNASVALESGSASVHDVEADVDVHTTSGNVFLSELTGAVQAQSTSGDIAGTGLSSNTVISTVSGSIALEFSEPPAQVEVESISGPIYLEVPRGEAYQVLVSSTRVWDADIQVDTDPEAEFIIDLRNASGEVTVSYSD